MILHVDPASATPPYEQLREQLAMMIATGVLPSGGRLPSIRQLAADLDLAQGTVGRAYAELERDGLIRTRRGRQGTVVLDGGPPRIDPAERERQLVEAARRFAVQAHQLGVETERALGYAERTLAALHR